MTSIRFADTPGHKLCRQFCRKARWATLGLRDELHGLCQSFDRLDDYAALPDLAQDASGHPTTREVHHD
jgi:hypothetical protein